MSTPGADGDEVDVEQTPTTEGRHIRVERCFYDAEGNARDGRWVEFTVPETANFEEVEAWVGSMVEALGKDAPAK